MKIGHCQNIVNFCLSDKLNFQLKVYLNDNYIPPDISYDIKNFEEFYKQRKEILKVALNKILLGVSND